MTPAPRRHSRQGAVCTREGTRDRRRGVHRRPFDRSVGGGRTRSEGPRQSLLRPKREPAGGAPRRAVDARRLHRRARPPSLARNQRDGRRSPCSSPGIAEYDGSCTRAPRGCRAVRGGLPKREDMAPVPSPYAIAKLAGEGYVRAFATLFGMKTLTLQYFNVFGPRQDPESPYSGVISRFATALLQGRSPTIHGDGRQSRDFTYVANVVDANRRGYGPLVDFETGCDTPSTGTSPCSDRYLLQEVRVAPAASPSGRPGASGALPDPYRFRRGTIRHSDIVTPWDLGITAISVAAFWHRMETTLAEAVSPPEL